jgi:23S rRNA (cytidine1920-2'-O)/16S rRNA (cytidine1409-2'-O)-methyltransferase
VYAVDTGYGVIDWKLRNDPRVVLMERTNAMHCLLPEKADLVSVDASWTRLEKIMPNILANLKPDGTIIFLIKPHYEAERHMIHKGKLQDEYVDGIVQKTVSSLEHFPVSVKRVIESPILGEKSKNREFLVFLGRTG